MLKMCVVDLESILPIEGLGIKDNLSYDMSVHYHPCKANVVADALSRLSMCSVAHVEEERKELEKDVHRLARLGVCLMSISDIGIKVQNGEESS